MEVQSPYFKPLHHRYRGGAEGGLLEAWVASGDPQEALKGEALVWRSLSILLKQVSDQRRDN